MVKEEGLNQVGPVNLEGYLLEEVVDVQAVLPDHIDDQLVLLREPAVQVECAYGPWRQSVALEWVQAVVRLGDIIDDHY